MTDKTRVKPTGRTGPISIGPAGATRHFVEFPKAKADIELFIAKLFCEGKSGMKQQIERYGAFTELEQQSEDRPDFKVKTERGEKWLELTEFAPLAEFGHSYENVPSTWRAEDMRKLVRELIDKKAAKGYGADVILVIYKTHANLFVAPPILRALSAELASDNVPFEAIYYVSPHDQECASTWEIFPGGPLDERWTLRSGNIRIGFDGREPAPREPERLPKKHDD